MSNNEVRTIAVMTSGGDAPGMNPAIRAVVRTAIANQIRAYGVEGGFDGIIHGAFKVLGVRNMGGILQKGGTVLQTRRSKDFYEVRSQREAIRQLNNAGIDGLVVIGGDGSLSGAHALAEQGIHVVGIPASIDNDIWGTDMCIGVDTALNTIVEAIDKVRDTASSHNRAFIIETMGRHSGYLAVTAGIIGGAEVVLIPEVKTTVDDVAQKIEDAYRRGKTHAIIIVAEGSSLRAVELSEALNGMDVGFSTRVTILGHIQRGGKPSAFDRMLASRFGVKAIEFFIAGKNDVMTGLQGSKVEAVSLADVISNKKEINLEYYEMARILAR